MRIPEWKKIAVIGSTGNLGRQTLDVLENLGLRDSVVLLSGGSNFTILREEARKFERAELHLFDSKAGEELERMLGRRVFKGLKDLELLLEDLKPDLVFVEISGLKSLKVVLKSLEISKRVALASKESLVVGGKFVLEKYKRMRDTELIPVDSEHSAIFQLLLGEKKENLDEIVLTASGGALRDWDLTRMKDARIDDVLKHPVWKMGKKITVDSATMVNKVMEIVEARYLFEIPFERIRALLHREGLIHSMVKFTDGIWKIHFGFPNMKKPIAFSITYPYRLRTDEKFIDPLKLLNISLEEIDRNRYPIFDLFDRMLNLPSSSFIVFNVADEIAVREFLNGRIPFSAISVIISNTVLRFDHFEPRDLKDVHEIDGVGRRMAEEEVEKWV